MSPTPERVALLAAVARHVPVSARPLLVAVDGVDGAGKTWFADELAEALRGDGRTVVRASVDDFHFPRSHRHAHGRTAEAVWTRHFDYHALRRELVDPWRAGAGAPYRRCWHDVRADRYVDVAQEAVPDSGVLLVDGVFTQRPELREVWDVVVFLDVSFEVSVRRLAARDGGVPDVAHPDRHRYVEAQRHYLSQCRPDELADLVVDNTDPDRPVLLGEDGTPGGWSRVGDELVKEVRLPASAPDVARAVDELESRAGLS